MKLKDFISEEVQILLQRMKDFPSEFVDESKWDTYLPLAEGIGKNYTHLNFAERFLIRRQWSRTKRNYITSRAEKRRQKARERILATIIQYEKGDRVALENIQHPTPKNRPISSIPMAQVEFIERSIEDHFRRLNTTQEIDLEIKRIEAAERAKQLILAGQQYANGF